MIKKLDAEITSRLSYFASIYPIHPQKALFALEKPSEAEYPVSVFPEHSNKNIRSLLWELAVLVPENEKNELNKAYEESRKLPTIYLFEYQSVSKSPSNPHDSELAKIFRMIRYEIVEDTPLKSFNLKRWGEPLSILLGMKK